MIVSKYLNLLKMKKIAFFLFILGIFACKKETFTVNSSTITHNDILGKWEMIRYQDLDTNDDRLIKTGDPILGTMIVEFKADSTIGGKENCNTIQGNFLIMNQKIKIFNVGKTKVGCAQDWVKLFYTPFDQAETAFINKSDGVITFISSSGFIKVTMKKI
jgi:heat shock protein HslJ